MRENYPVGGGAFDAPRSEKTNMLKRAVVGASPYGIK